MEIKHEGRQENPPKKEVRDKFQNQEKTALRCADLVIVLLLYQVRMYAIPVQAKSKTTI